MKITDTMEAFLAGESTDFLEDCSSILSEQWATSSPGALTATFSLLWNSRRSGWIGSSEDLLSALIGSHGTLDHCRLERLALTAGSGGAISRNFRSAVLIECDFDSTDLRKSRFSGSWLESTSFANSDLRGVAFDGASILDVDFTGADLAGADFASVDLGLSFRIDGVDYAKERALGVLAARGASTAAVDQIYIAMAHPHYDIARKIARRLCEGGTSQYLGLTQRGASSRDPKAAVAFVDMLVSLGYATFERSGAARTVDLTVAGRVPVRKLAEETGLEAPIAGYFAGKHVKKH